MTIHETWAAQSERRIDLVEPEPVRSDKDASPVPSRSASPSSAPAPSAPAKQQPTMATVVGVQRGAAAPASAGHDESKQQSKNVGTQCCVVGA